MDTKDKLVLWLAGSGFSEEETNKVLEQERVRRELKLPKTDAVELMRAIRDAAGWHVGKNPFPGNDPLEKLNFLFFFR